MSDECLMKEEFGFPFYVVYQAVMRKFTLADKSYFIVYVFYFLQDSRIKVQIYFLLLFAKEYKINFQLL